MKNTNSSKENREKVIVQTSFIGIVANVILAVFKEFVGMVTNAIAITLNTGASMITILGQSYQGKHQRKSILLDIDVLNI